MITAYLNFEGRIVSKTTIYKYLKELGLKSIARPKKYKYIQGNLNKKFSNLLKRNFKTNKPNIIWCIDFTYFPYDKEKMRYNCTIIDLYNRKVVGSLNSGSIGSELALTTLKMALKRENINNELILHSDQGSQFTSKIFTDYCKENKIIQSMSKAGCPYDNSPMEQFYNTLKTEFYKLYKFSDIKDLDRKTYEFIYVKYNYLRPHSYTNGLPLALYNSNT